MAGAWRNYSWYLKNTTRSLTFQAKTSRAFSLLLSIMTLSSISIPVVKIYLYQIYVQRFLHSLIGWLEKHHMLLTEVWQLLEIPGNTDTVYFCKRFNDICVSFTRGWVVDHSKLTCALSLSSHKFLIELIWSIKMFVQTCISDIFSCNVCSGCGASTITRKTKWPLWDTTLKKPHKKFKRY